VRAVPGRHAAGSGHRPLHLRRRPPPLSAAQTPELRLFRVPDTWESSCEGNPHQARARARIRLRACTVHVRAGHYDIRRLPAISCFDTDFKDLTPAAVSDTGCGKCPSEVACMNCTSDRTARPGGPRAYGLRVDL
jgi:hypothetical protein